MIQDIDPKRFYNQFQKETIEKTDCIIIFHNGLIFAKEIGETVEETVRREVMEEVGLHIKNIRYYKSQPWGFDLNLLLGFFCELDDTASIHRDEGELALAEWVKREDVPDYGEDLSLTHEMMRRFKEEKY